MNSPTAESPLWRLFALEPVELTAIERMLLYVALFVSVFAFGWTYLDNRTYAGNDLRNRVVGARVMLTGQDPYTFHWQDGMPGELLDPIHDPNAHRLTISPPTLLLYAVAARVPYRIQRFGWFVAEWLALIVSLMLLARSLPEMRQRVVLLLGATLFVIATDVWRLHLERGQIYVFQLLALSAAIAWSRRGQADTIAAGIALGLLALMRPNLLVLAPALLLIRQWRSSSAMMATVGAGVALAFMMLPTSSWQSYLNIGDQYYRALEEPEPAPPEEPSYEPTRPNDTIPIVEDVRFFPGLANISSSSFAYTYRLLSQRFGWPMIDLALTSKFLLAATAGLLLLVLWRRGQMPGAYALAIVGALNSEFFLPHRWGYVDVMLLAPVALMLPALWQVETTNRWALGIVIVGLLSGPFGQLFVGIEVATVLRSWLVMGGLTWLAISSAPPTPHSESASV